MEYSIWVVPPEPVYGRLKSIIKNLAGKYRGPTFEPHMTILGNIEKNLDEIKEKTSLVASKLNKLKLTLGQVSFSTTYFQSVFVRVDSTAELLQINLELKRQFRMENTVFMPHISLLYGDHDMQTREKVANEIKMTQSSFTVDKFIVTPVTQEPDRWKYTMEIPFG
ncbi:2'-5' RNA ligase family protein [Candidatus Gottesmanbacteria bacterium]|nr:2'-5' RNA ligase family protein [Candidatus Gottesmanbacteria bacterium]